MASTHPARIEVRADKNCGDDYNVMGALPGTALWIRQLSSHNAATAFATRLAAATALSFDAQLTRRA